MSERPIRFVPSGFWRYYCTACGCAHDQNPTATAALLCHCGSLSFSTQPPLFLARPCPREVRS